MQGNDGIDYKKKYMDLRARFIEALDVAFRTGYEQGANETQVQNMAQQAQMQAQQAAMMQSQMAAGPGMDQQAPGAEMSPDMQGQGPVPEAGGDEMDGAIAELEGLVNKKEPSIDDLKKSLETIKNSRMHQKLQKATKQIGKKMAQAPQPLSLSYSVNLPEESKQVVSMQSKVVSDILNKWENEAQKSARDITSVLGNEALLKKE